MSVYTGVSYREDDVSIGAPDVAAVRSGQESGNWDLSWDPSTGQRLEAAMERAALCYFSIYYRDALVGQILLHDIDEAAGESLVVYHIFEARYRRMGIGTKALLLLQGFVIEETSLTRLIAITSVDNAASRRIAEKCGFIHAGAPREDPTSVLMEWQVPGGG